MKEHRQLLIFILLVILTCIVGCKAHKASKTSNDIYTLQGIPYDAVLIELIEAPMHRNVITWVQWEYKANCFMSKTLSGRSGNITWIPCPDSIDRTKRIRNGEIIYMNK